MVPVNPYQNMQQITVGIYPYGDRGNPYQAVIAKTLTGQGLNCIKLQKSNFLPLYKSVRQPIDVLQIYWPHSMFTGATLMRGLIKKTLYSIDLNSLKRKKTVFSAENLYPHDSVNIQEDIRYTQKILDACKGILFMSEQSRQIYQTIYRLPESTVQAVIPHIHYLDTYANTVTHEEARNHLGIPDGKKVILFLGALRPYKGLVSLIKSFAHVSTENDCLVIAGMAKDEAFAAELNAMNLNPSSVGKGEVKIFNRFIPDDELQYFYQACDAVAIPYDDMPINPGSLILAMGFGKCIIAPLKGAIPELVCADALFGYDEQETGALAAALFSFLSSTGWAAKGIQNKTRVLERHSPQVAGQKYVEFYTKLFSV